jgi:hypothetical protein
MFNSNQAFLIGTKVQISPKGFTLGVKAEIEKICKCFLGNFLFWVHVKVEEGTCWKGGGCNARGGAKGCSGREQNVCRAEWQWLKGGSPHPSPKLWHFPCMVSLPLLLLT